MVAGAGRTQAQPSAPESGVYVVPLDGGGAARLGLAAACSATWSPAAAPPCGCSPSSELRVVDLDGAQTVVFRAAAGPGSAPGRRHQRTAVVAGRPPYRSRSPPSPPAGAMWSEQAGPFVVEAGGGEPSVSPPIAARPSPGPQTGRSPWRRANGGQKIRAATAVADLDLLTGQIRRAQLDERDGLCACPPLDGGRPHADVLRRPVR
ncbi:MAG: hypothetical protein U0531_01210 [Dehalococcoidia bacterium]